MLDAAVALQRHLRGDWGELDRDDLRTNDYALRYGGRLFSAFKDRNGTKFWIITEASREYTTILLPDEY